MGGGAPDISVGRPDFTPPVGQKYTSTRDQLHSFGGDLLPLAGGGAASRRMFRGRSTRCGECVVCIDPKRQRKEKCTANVAAEPVQPASPSPPPPSSRQCKAP